MNCFTCTTSQKKLVKIKLTITCDNALFVASLTQLVFVPDHGRNELTMTMTMTMTMKMAMTMTITVII